MCTLLLASAFAMSGMQINHPQANAQKSRVPGQKNLFMKLTADGEAQDRLQSQKCCVS